MTEKQRFIEFTASKMDRVMPDNLVGDRLDIVIALDDALTLVSYVTDVVRRSEFARSKGDVGVTQIRIGLVGKAVIE